MLTAPSHAENSAVCGCRKVIQIERYGDRFV